MVEIGVILKLIVMKAKKACHMKWQGVLAYIFVERGEENGTGYN